MTKKRKRVLIGSGVGGAVILFSVLAIAGGREKGIEVRTEKVKKRNLVAMVTASGHIRPQRSVDIQADVAGRIVELRAQEGDMVKRGDILLRIDPTTFEAAVQRARAAVAQAEAQLAQARANVEQAARNLERVQSLKNENPTLVSDEQLELARTNYEVQHSLTEAADHAVRQARAALREASDQLAKTIIRAPMDGQVTRVNVEEGETAIIGTMNNPGTILLTVADLSEMEAAVEVDETDVPQLHRGDSATVEIDAFPNRKFVGRVTKIGHSAIQGPGTTAPTTGRSAERAVDFEVVIALANPPPGLRPGLSATADIVTGTRDSALSIPIIALTLKDLGARERAPRERTGDTLALGVRAEEEVEGVYVVKERRVEFRPVKVGLAGQNHFEVLEGLQEGEEIVAGSYQAIRRLKDGARVKVTRRDSEGERGERGS